jgi:hypothetical protein
MRKYHDTIPEFKEYVDRFCKKHHISVDEALEQNIIKDVLKYYLAIK